MNWSHPDQHHWRRDDGRYFIDEAVTNRFTAWFKQHADALAEWLGCYDDLRSATQRCKAHERDYVPSTTTQNELFQQESAE